MHNFMDYFMDYFIDNFMDNGDFGQKTVGKNNIKRQNCQQRIKNGQKIHFFWFFVGHLEKND